MSRTIFTLRIDIEERLALENFSRIEGRPTNHLVSEAIKSYLRKRDGKRRRLETHLADLRAYRKKDPGFKKAIENSWRLKLLWKIRLREIWLKERHLGLYNAKSETC
jgi:hypothetical protein